MTRTLNTPPHLCRRARVHSRVADAPRERGVLLSNRHVKLVDPMPENYPALFRIARSGTVVDRWQSGSQNLGYEVFKQRFWDSVLAQFVFGLPSESRVLGLVKCEVPNFRHQTAHFGIYSDPGVHSSPVPLRAILTLVNFVFHTYPLRKLYAEVPAYNYALFASGADNFFTVEGILRDHEMHFGKLWDLHIVAVSRELWMAEIAPIVTSWRS